MPSPNGGQILNILHGVAAVSANDVWAVGYYYLNGSGTSQTLVEHWDGSTWSVVPSPSLSTNGNYLYAVTALSTNDVWAAGYYDNNDNHRFQTLVEHWNGTEWLAVPSPNVGTGVNDYSFLLGLSAVSVNDVWAVGYVQYDSGAETLVEHWNGMEWSVVPSPNGGTSHSHLFAVSAVSANDVWAVGYYGNGSMFQTLVEHWNGTEWSVVPSPNGGTGNGYLQGVTAISANDVWAVGWYSGGTLVEHWDGTAWSVVPSPNVGTSNGLNGVTAVSASDVWSVGNYISGTGSERTLTEHHLSPCAPTSTPSSTPTSTATPAPLLVGHVVWQGPPAQPHARQQLPITLTLKSGTTTTEYPSENTDASGYFTVTAPIPATGPYNWRVKGPKYLAKSGVIDLTGSPTMSLEIGLMLVGDCNNDNAVGAVDFAILKGAYGLGGPDPGFDARADLDNNNFVSAVDFGLLRNNYGRGGAPPIGPAGP